MAFFGAESGISETGIAAIIVAISGLIGGVFTALWQVIKYGGERVDKSTAESLRTMAQRVEDMAERVREANEGEHRAIEDRNRVIRERNDARAEIAAAYRKADEWLEMWKAEQARANALEVKLATRPTADPNAGA
jgi:hypothetical protein